MLQLLLSLRDALLPLLAERWHELGVIFYLLLRTWTLRRRSVWLRRLLELEQRRHIASQNETVKILSTAFASGEPPTLDDLLSHAERDWSLRSSRPPPEPPTQRVPRSEHSGLNLKPR